MTPNLLDMIGKELVLRHCTQCLAGSWRQNDLIELLL